jgi:hypothetical protein
MAKSYEERVFTENIDRLVAGQDIGAISEADDDLRSALDFARKMTALRPAPSAVFQSNLKARLLQKINENEAPEKSGWFWRLIPREPIWQAVAVLAVIAVVGGVLWGTLFRSAPNPIANLPTPPPVTTTVPPVTTATTTTTAPPTTTPAPVTTTSTTTTTVATTTTATTTIATVAPTTSPPVSYPAGTYLVASAGTDKSIYNSGETVRIEVTLQNVTSQPFTIEQYPPILSLMQSPSKLPVYTFTVAAAPLTLAPGQKVTFDENWPQVDANGVRVSPGSYYLELEDIDYQGRALHLNLAQPVSFTIY